MTTVHKLNTERLLDPAHAELDGQARVNAEIFTAVEILGRKLERSEAERDRLARRLALIEASAEVDEKTGKLYLPVLMDLDMPLRGVASSTPQWMVAASLMSSAVALFALGLVLFRDPVPVLTKEQLAALDSLRGLQFASLAPESKGWKHLEAEQPVDNAENTAAAPAPQLPTSAELAKLEQEAQPPKPVETPVIAEVIPAAPVKAETVLVPVESRMAEKTADKPAAPKEANKQAAVAAPAAGKPVTAAVSAPPVTGSSVLQPDSGLPENLAQLQKRAYQGIPEAQHDLATLYASGKMVAQNYPRAIYWFTKSAEGGVANANYNLGVIYHQGLGVPADMQKAIAWYDKAAELGHPEAMYNLGIAYIEGIGTKTNVEKGVSYFKRAANAGVAQAAYNLGVLYESNFIGSIDIGKAVQWYQVAANEGHAQAHDAIVRLKGATATAAARSGDQALTLAEMVEPSAGEEVGEGDSSPVDEGRNITPHESKNELLAKIQQLLIRQGILPGPADGVMTPQTEDAIRVTQKKMGMPEDGEPSQELLDKMQQSAPTNQ